jgi:hypothetical protein
MLDAVGNSHLFEEDGELRGLFLLPKPDLDSHRSGDRTVAVVLPVLSSTDTLRREYGALGISSTEAAVLLQSHPMMAGLRAHARRLSPLASAKGGTAKPRLCFTNRLVPTDYSSQCRDG